MIAAAALITLARDGTVSSSHETTTNARREESSSTIGRVFCIDSSSDKKDDSSNDEKNNDDEDTSNTGDESPAPPAPPTVRLAAARVEYDQNSDTEEKELKSCDSSKTLTKGGLVTLKKRLKPPEYSKARPNWVISRRFLRHLPELPESDVILFPYGYFQSIASRSIPDSSIV